MNDGLIIARLAIGLVFLLIASAQDLKRRRVNDIIWILLGALSMVLIAVQLLVDDTRWEYYLVLVPIAILFFDVFWDRKAIYHEGKFRFVPAPILLYLVAFLVMTWLFLTFNNDIYFLGLFTAPAMILVCYGLYYTRVLRGGADAKAIMSISILMPYYPILNGMPLISMGSQFLDVTSVLFPFGLLVLMNASILFLFSPLAFLFYNIKRGDVRFPQCLFGYRVDIDRVKRFVWVMERLEDDELKISIFPKRRERKRETIRKLKEFGLKKVWVTPQIPFIVPITIGFILSFLIGNIFLGLVLLVA